MAVNIFFGFYFLDEFDRPNPHPDLPFEWDESAGLEYGDGRQLAAKFIEWCAWMQGFVEPRCDVDLAGWTARCNEAADVYRQGASMNYTQHTDIDVFGIDGPCLPYLYGEMLHFEGGTKPLELPRIKPSCWSVMIEFAERFDISTSNLQWYVDGV